MRRAARHARMVGGSAQAGHSRRSAGSHQDRPRTRQRSSACTRACAINPGTLLTCTPADGIDPRCLIEAEAPANRRGGLAGRAGGSAHDGIASFVLAPEVPIAWEVFTRAMETLRRCAVRTCCGLKASSTFGCRGPVVVQIVQHLAHSPVEPRAGRTATARAVSSSSRNVSERGVGLLESVQALTTGSMT